MVRAFVVLVIFPVLCHADLVLQLEDLGPANAIHGNNSAGVVVGQKNNAATTFNGGTTTQIVAPNSTAISAAGDYVTGHTQNGQPLAFRYNVQTSTNENFPENSDPTFGVDITSNGTALLYGVVSPTSTFAVIWHPDNNIDLALSVYLDFSPRGLTESQTGVGFSTIQNAAKFFSLSNPNVETFSVSNYDPTAGYEGNITAGKKVSTNEPAYFIEGDTNLTLIPKLDPLNSTGEVTAFNTLGQFVGSWDTEFFLYNKNNSELTNLSDLAQTGALFDSINVPTALNEMGQIYGVGLVNGELHAYRGTIGSTAIPETSPAQAVGLIVKGTWSWVIKPAANTVIRVFKRDTQQTENKSN